MALLKIASSTMETGIPIKMAKIGIKTKIMTMQSEMDEVLLRVFSEQQNLSIVTQIKIVRIVE